MMSHGGSALRFVQISDSHIGFDKPANTDVTATLRAAIAKIKAAPEPPAFVLHTGDLTHLSKPAEFDTLQQCSSELSLPVFYVPGEHDVLDDDGKSYLERFGKGTQGAGWHSFDQRRRPLHRPRQRREPQGRRARHARRRAARVAREGRQAADEQHADRRLRAHPALVGLSGVGLGHRRRRAGAVYLKRFGSVSVLNGHIHQVMQKVEGHVTFHTAMSTAFPQPAPGHGAVAGTDEGGRRSAAQGAGSLAHEDSHDSRLHSLALALASPPRCQLAADLRA